MPVQAPCPSCKTLLAFPSDVAGKVIRCPKCQKTIRVNAAPRRPTPSPAGEFDLGPAQGDIVPRRRRRRRSMLPRVLVGTLVLLVLAGGVTAAWLVWREHASEKIAQAAPPRATPPAPQRVTLPTSASLPPPTMATPPVLPKTDAGTPVPKKETVVPTPAAPKEQPKPPPAKKIETPPPLPEQTRMPHLVVRVRSAKAVLDASEKVAEATGEDSPLDPLLAKLKGQGKEALPGVDLEKPLGLYLLLGDNGPPEIVGLVPVNDKARFLTLLKNLAALLGSQLEEGDQGSRLLQHPRLGTLTVRFAHDYACFVLGDLGDSLGEPKLLRPTEVFKGTQTVLTSATLHIDRIPQSQRAQVQPQIEALGQSAWQFLSFILPRSRRTTNRAVLKLLGQGTADLLAEGKALTLDLDLDQEKQKLTAEVRFTAAENSELATSFKSFGKSPSAFANLLTADCALSALIHANLPAPLRKELKNLVRDLVGGSAKGKDKKDGSADALVRALEPTVTGGELDLGMVIRTGGANQPATILGGVKIVDAPAIEKWFRDAVPTWAAEYQALFQFDQDKYGAVPVHGIHLPVPPGGIFFQLLGNDPGLLAFRKDAVLFCLGRKNEEALRKAVESPAAAAPVFHLQVNLKRIVELIDPVDKGLAEELFTDENPGRLEINLRGGQAVTLRFELDVNFLQFIAEQQLLRFEYKTGFLERTRSFMSSASVPALPEGAKVKLSVTQGLRVGKNYALKDGVTYIGRKGQHAVDVDLTEQECPGKPVAVNRFALIWLDKNGLAIADTGRRVTKINGTLVPPGKRIPLNAEDTLQFGKTALQVKVILKKRTAAQK